MRAKTQYNDLIGTVAADISDFMPESNFQSLLYNRGIQMYRFPNSDVQKSVIFEGIKKRLKIV